MTVEEAREKVVIVFPDGTHLRYSELWDMPEDERYRAVDMHGVPKGYIASE